jgi:phosphoheptose isomerase
MRSCLTGNAEELQLLLAQISNYEVAVVAAARSMATAFRQGNKLLACGNGGSAADSSHLTTEFVCRFQKDRRPYPAISFTTHGGDLTAIGNDYQFIDIFSRQVEAFGMPGDVLAVFTTSGKSENVRRALETAKQMRIMTIAFLGKDGGCCKGLADNELLVQSSTTARIQEMHQLLMHTICELVEEQL